ncbi:MAG: hypothetical protein FWG28_00750 [Clostridiales bacterium]|nr:hypothetical protein [Clostridiales bacterium]
MNWFRKFMQGRYGPDQLTYALIVIYWPFAFAVRLTGFRIFDSLAYLCIFTAAFRFLSKNIARRRRENQKFLSILQPVTGWAKLTRRRIAERRTHRFFKCPGCGQILRVPAGKGRITIRCSKCGAALEKKT